MDRDGRSGRAALNGYLKGYALALLLTFIPFALAVWKAGPLDAIYCVIAVAAVVQVLVHMRYFLHLDPTATPRENLAALAFAAILIGILAGGTLWIMINLGQRMM